MAVTPAAPGGATVAGDRAQPEPERQAEPPGERQAEPRIERRADRHAEPRPSSSPVPLPMPPAEAPAPPPDEAAWRIAWLEGRVAALEAALKRRSGELLLLQRFLCPQDLAQWMRLSAGLPPLPRIPYEPAFWRESCELAMAEVPETLEALWSSIYTPITR